MSDDLNSPTSNVPKFTEARHRAPWAMPAVFLYRHGIGRALADLGDYGADLIKSE